MHPQGRKEWSKWVARAEASGQTLTEFAAEHELSRSALYFWRRKLHNAQAEAPAALSFVRVEAVEPVPAKDLELLLRNGRLVRVSPGFDEDTLARLLVVAEGGDR